MAQNYPPDDAPQHDPEPSRRASDFVAAALDLIRQYRDMTNPHILIVEDDPASAEGLRDVLEDCEYQSIWAKVPAEALEAIGRDERIGVILLDLRLPELDGIRLLSRLRDGARDRGPSLQAILCSGNAEPRDLDSAMRSGFSAFLPKPINRMDLINALGDAVRRYAQAEHDRGAREGLLSRFRKLEDSFGTMARDVAGLTSGSLVGPLGENLAGAGAHPQLDRAWLTVQCRRLLREARQMDALLGRLKLDDGEWRALLALFDADLDGKGLPVTSLALASGTSASAGLRRVATLAERGLVSRSEDEDDARRALVMLTQDGRILCREALEAIAAARGAS